MRKDYESFNQAVMCEGGSLTFSAPLDKSITEKFPEIREGNTYRVIGGSMKETIIRIKQYAKTAGWWEYEIIEGTVKPYGGPYFFENSQFHGFLELC